MSTKSSLRIDIITLFPEMLTALESGIPSRAREQGALLWQCWNPRDYTDDPNRRVDDRPYGGGPGMVMKYEPLRDTLKAIHSDVTASALTPGPVVYLSPTGNVTTQSTVQTLSSHTQITLVAGRYEGIDQRFIDKCVDQTLSIGDYVLSGGELPAMVLIDGISRLLPNVLGHPDSATRDSFSDGLLEHPQYTRPEAIDGMTVPNILLCGNHQAISDWQHKESLIRTWQTRPDLIQRRALSNKEATVLRSLVGKGPGSSSEADSKQENEADNDE